MLLISLVNNAKYPYDNMVALLVNRWLTFSKWVLLINKLYGNEYTRKILFNVSQNVTHICNAWTLYYLHNGLCTNITLKRCI